MTESDCSNSILGFEKDSKIVRKTSGSILSPEKAGLPVARGVDVYPQKYFLPALQKLKQIFENSSLTRILQC